MRANGLDANEAAALVLWGGPPEVPEAVGLLVPEAVPETVRERVGEAMVVLVPADWLIVAETEDTLRAELDEARAEETDAEATEEAEERTDETEAEAEADEIEPEPPVRGNWPE